MLPTRLYNVGKLLATGNQNRNLRSSTAQTNLQLQTKISNRMCLRRRSFMNSSVNPSADHLILLPLTRLKQAFRQQLGCAAQSPNRNCLKWDSRTGSNRFRLPVNRCSTERLAWFVVATAPATTIYPRYVGGNRWDRNQRRPGSDHEFGQESPEFRTRTSVGGLSTYWARRQVAPSDCWGLGARKAEQRLPARRDNARGASRE